jgi:hypothetical protein
VEALASVITRIEDLRKCLDERGGQRRSKGRKIILRNTKAGPND